MDSEQHLRLLENQLREHWALHSAQYLAMDLGIPAKDDGIDLPDGETIEGELTVVDKDQLLIEEKDG